MGAYGGTPEATSAGAAPADHEPRGTGDHRYPAGRIPVLTTTDGTWTNAPTDFEYQWKSGGANVGADQNTYTPVAADLGNTITVTVTATRRSVSRPGSRPRHPPGRSPAPPCAADREPDPAHDHRRAAGRGHAHRGQRHLVQRTHRLQLPVEVRRRERRHRPEHLQPGRGRRRQRHHRHGHRDPSQLHLLAPPPRHRRPPSPPPARRPPGLPTSQSDVWHGSCDSPATGTVHEVGPGQANTSIGDVDWLALGPGDRVQYLRPPDGVPGEDPDRPPGHPRAPRSRSAVWPMPKATGR